MRLDDRLLRTPRLRDIVGMGTLVGFGQSRGMPRPAPSERPGWHVLIMQEASDQIESRNGPGGDAGPGDDAVPPVPSS